MNVDIKAYQNPIKRYPFQWVIIRTYFEIFNSDLSRTAVLSIRFYFNWTDILYFTYFRFRLLKLIGWMR